MTTGTVWGITLILLGALAALGGLQLFVAGTFPGVVGQASRNLRTKDAPLWVVVLVGLGVVGATFSLALIIGLLPGAAKVLALLPVLVIAVIHAAGLAAVSHTVGTNLGSALDRRAPSRRLLRGAIASELAYVIPVLGWFFLLPIALIVGSGAALVSVFQGDKRRDAVSELRLVSPPAPATAREAEAVAA